MRRIALLLVAALAVFGAACMPTQPGPIGASPEHDQCVAGAEAAKAHRPDLILTDYRCADFGDTGWAGLFYGSVHINEHYTWYTPYGGAGGGYYCVAAHEWGHAWDWYRLGWSHGGYPEPEAYARAFAAAYFGC